MPLQTLINAWCRIDLKLTLGRIERGLSPDMSRPAQRAGTPFSSLLQEMFARRLRTQPRAWFSSDNKTLGTEIAEEMILAFFADVSRDLDDQLATTFPIPILSQSFIDSTERLLARSASESDPISLFHTAFLGFGEDFIDIRTLLRLRGGPLLPRPGLKAYGSFLLDYSERAISAIREFQRQHDIQYCTADGEIRAFYNYLNFLVHEACAAHRFSPEPRLVNVYLAASALHPVVDDWMDAGASVDELSILESLLAGDECRVIGQSQPLQRAARLINIIYTEYPPSRHTDLKDILLGLYRWQIASAKQRCGDISDEDLLRVSFMKGGYAFAFFGYLVLGSLRGEAFRHFFAMGALFQLMDDFHDFADDLHLGHTTAWTRIYRQDGSLDSIFVKLHEVHLCYERLVSLNNAAETPNLVEAIEQFGYRYDSFRFACMSWDYFSEEFRSTFSGYFPFDLKGVIQVFQQARDNENLDKFVGVVERFRA